MMVTCLKGMCEFRRFVNLRSFAFAIRNRSRTCSSEQIDEIAKRDSSSTRFPSHRRSNHANLFHQLGELLRIERLRAVGQRLVGLMMDFDQQRIGARRHRSPRHGRHFVAASGAVRRVGGHRQMREFVDDRNRGNVHRVARVGFKGADAALAQNDFVVAAREQVFRGAAEALRRWRQCRA